MVPLTFQLQVHTVLVVRKLAKNIYPTIVRIERSPNSLSIAARAVLDSQMENTSYQHGPGDIIFQPLLQNDF